MRRSGLLLADDLPRLAVVAESPAGPVAWPDCPPGMACITALLPYRAAAAAGARAAGGRDHARPMPTPRAAAEFDGRLIGTRQIGRMLYVVARTHRSWPSTCCRWCQRRRPAGRAGPLTMADVLPKISVNGGPRQPLVAETDCWLQPANASTRSR
jgi:hypothetical protein